MLEFIIQGKRMIYLLLFPIIGLAFDLYLRNQNTIKYIKYISLLLLFPLLFNFNFRVPYLDVLLILLILASFYSEYSKKILLEKKAGKVILWTFLLALFLGSWCFISNILAITKTKRIYSHNSYSVYDHSDRGFAGGTAHNYELCHNALIPLYEKSIQTTRKRDSCFIYFTPTIHFDKCNSELTFNNGK